MSHNTIKKRVKTLVAREFNVDDEILVSDISLKQLGADSLDKLKLLMDLEEEFDVRLPDGCVSKLNTLEDAVVLIEHRHLEAVVA